MKIENLATIKGRLLLKSIFENLRFEKQRSGFSVFFIMLGICISDKKIEKYIPQDTKVLYSLGFKRGLLIWMEEILNRYYFSAINSFVYFGAAILLVLVALQRFSDILSDKYVILGVALESLMLLLMFFVMLFTPNTDLSDSEEINNDKSGTEELINEIGEIGSDLASAVLQLENISESLKNILIKQEEILEKSDKIVKTNVLAVNPNPKMLEIMRATNGSMIEFNQSVDRLTKSADRIREIEIQEAVKKELAKIINSNISGTNG